MAMKPKAVINNPANTAVVGVPPVPSLPVTTVNPQPRNEASPVAPAKRSLGEFAKSTVQAVDKAFTEKAGDDKGFGETKPKTRNRAIETQAILKSTLESPTLAQMCHGKDDMSVIKTLGDLFRAALKLYDEAK